MFGKSFYSKLLILYTAFLALVLLFFVFPVLSFTPLIFVINSEIAVLIHILLLIVFWISFIHLLIKKNLKLLLVLYSLVVLILSTLITGYFATDYLKTRVNWARSADLESKVSISLDNFESKPISKQEQKISYQLNVENLPNTNRYYVFEIKLLRTYDPTVDPTENYVAETTIKIAKQDEEWQISESTYGFGVNDKKNYIVKNLPNVFDVTYTYNPQELTNFTLEPNTLEVKFSECDKYCNSLDRPIFYGNIDL